MSRSVEPTRVIRHEDGSFIGAWGPYALRSAFQPIFRFVEGRLEAVAFEGLIRPFRDGEGVSPPVFFRAVPAGERLHVETLTRSLHLLNAGIFLPQQAQVFVNFDPSVYAEAEMARTALRDMRRVLQDAKLDPKRVVCEVTEQKTSSERALTNFVDVLRNQGFRIAVDDYGAEESDMERVSALRPDIVKFDAHWIARLMDSQPGVALLTVMVREFSGRGISVVFEGLEESWQLEIAEQVGAEMVQGYVLARPAIVPASFSIFTADGSPTSPGPATAGLAARTPEPADRPRHGHSSTRTFGRRTAS